jgi:hypothetical protein
MAVSYGGAKLKAVFMAGNAVLHELRKGMHETKF